MAPKSRGCVHAQRPHLPVLFVTGFVDRGALAGVDESRIIAKPFLPDELADKIRLALGYDGSSKVVRLRR